MMRSYANRCFTVTLMSLAIFLFSAGPANARQEECPLPQTPDTDRYFALELKGLDDSNAWWNSDEFEVRGYEVRLIVEPKTKPIAQQGEKQRALIASKVIHESNLDDNTLFLICTAAFEDFLKGINASSQRLGDVAFRIEIIPVEYRGKVESKIRDKARTDDVMVPMVDQDQLILSATQTIEINTTSLWGDQITLNDEMEGTILFGLTGLDNTVDSDLFVKKSKKEFLGMIDDPKNGFKPTYTYRQIATDNLRKHVMVKNF